MIHSLRWRLLLTMAAVIAVTAGTVALLSRQMTVAEFDRYVRLEDERSQRLGELFHATADLGGQPVEERQATIARLSEQLAARVILVDASGMVSADSAGLAVGQPRAGLDVAGAMVVTINPTGAKAVGPDAGFQLSLPAPGAPPSPAGGRFTSVITRAAPAGTGSPVATTSDVFLFGTMASDTLTSTLHVKSLPISVAWSSPESRDPIQAGFVAGVNRSLSLALVVAGLAALALTAALSRRIIGPVERLTLAARRMGAGDLSTRVAVGRRDEIAQLAAAFNTMAADLERTESLRRTMVSDVAHELRTPLTNIRGYLEALRDGVARPDLVTFDSLHEEALLLNRLIDDLQELALAEAGQLRLDRGPADVGLLAQQLIEAARPRLLARGVTVELNCPPDLPPAYADAERVGQILRNLLNNALTHTPAGGSVTLRVTKDEGRGMKDEGRRMKDEDRDTSPFILHPSSFILFEVSDTGCGIAPEDLPNIFERFYRADRSRARATGGAGLGLTIVRQLVEAHAGQIGVTSALGEGTTVCFTLPIATA